MTIMVFTFIVRLGSTNNINILIIAKTIIMYSLSSTEAVYDHSCC